MAAGKDGKEYILKASDSTFPLMGDTQEEDRRNIAELVSGRMQVKLCLSGAKTGTFKGFFFQ